MQLLLARGADPELRDTRGLTAMAAAGTVAAEHPHGHQVPVCVALLAAGADATARGSAGA